MMSLYLIKRIIISEEADIENEEWKLEKVRIFFDNGKKEILIPKRRRKGKPDKSWQES